MALRATVQLEQPDEVGVTMTFTMPLREWKQIRADLAKLRVDYSIPTFNLSNALAQLVQATHQTILAQPPEEAAPAVAEPAAHPLDSAMHAEPAAPARRRPAGAEPA